MYVRGATGWRKLRWRERARVVVVIRVEMLSGGGPPRGQRSGRAGLAGIGDGGDRDPWRQESGLSHGCERRVRVLYEE